MYYPSIYKAIGQREPKGQYNGDLPDDSDGEMYYAQALEGISIARKLSPVLTNPERRYELIKATEEALSEMKRLPHSKPDF